MKFSIGVWVSSLGAFFNILRRSPEIGWKSGTTNGRRSSHSNDEVGLLFEVAYVLYNIKAPAGL